MVLSNHLSVAGRSHWERPLRAPWTSHFPPVFIHTHYEADDDAGGAPGISDHPAFFPAKKRRDARAALRLIEDVAQDGTLDRLHDATVEFRQHGRLVVLAPGAMPSDSNNALAITYAHWLAVEMRWDVEERLFQRKDFSKDFSDFWPRLAHSSEFYGEITPGRHYVLVDDILTLGGTLADLRGFVIANGGHVVAMSTLAHRSGVDVQISLAEKTRFGLLSAYRGALDEFCAQELGYGQDCLTEFEGRRLQRFASLDAVRDGLNGARNG